MMRTKKKIVQMKLKKIAVSSFLFFFDVYGNNLGYLGNKSFLHIYSF